jgi:hypothetical protein
MPDGDRPLLALPRPERVAPRLPTPPRGGGGAKSPRKARQVERLTPQFLQLQAALEEKRAALQADAGAVAPEQVLVLETNGPVKALFDAVHATAGLEWLAEEDLLDVMPDDDFFVVDKPDKLLSARLYMVMSNEAALTQLLSLWTLWASDKRLPPEFRSWRDVFANLREIRRWGTEDRLRETGLHQDWEDRKTWGAVQVPVEVDLWFRRAQDRASALERVSRLIQVAGGQVVHTVSLPEIAYHAVLGRLPLDAVEQLLKDRTVQLVKSDDVRLFRPVPQARIARRDTAPNDDAPDAAPNAPLGEPVVALLDGLPLENHSVLRGRLTVEDPDGWAATYPVDQRVHGTAMASLIVHGDLHALGPPADRRLYVRPILRPNPVGQERAPDDRLWLDVVHSAVRRAVVGEAGAPPSAPGVRIINLSIGDAFQPFVDSVVSPLARLIDWLSWRYGVLFIVSAGNHSTVLDVAHDGDAAGFEEAALRAIQETHRHRRLLSPAESINAVTVGALHHDDAGPVAARYAEERFLVSTDGLPAPFSALGRGFRRSVKPDILAPGGRDLYARDMASAGPKLRFGPVHRPIEAPGQKVAAPSVRGTVFISGTSNSAALTTRAAERLLTVVRAIAAEAPHLADLPEAVLVKALLVHTAEWPAGAVDVLERALKNERNKLAFWDHLSAFVGYGVVHPDRAMGCTADRVTLLGGDTIGENERRVHRVPLPTGLNAFTGRRRLTATLAWLSPVNPGDRKYRCAALSFEAPKDDRTPLRVSRTGVDLRAVGRGTVQHVVLERESGAINVGSDDALELAVSCVFESQGGMGTVVPYGLAVTLEVAPGLGVSIYDQVRDRVRPRVQVR